MKIIQSFSTQIEIGDITKSTFASVIDSYSKANIIIIVDENTHDYCLEFLLTNFSALANAEIILLPEGEENKVMEVCFQVWETFTEFNFSRKDLVINLGGGIVTDMGGFIASIFKRGMNFIHVPTSLLGMVDASIGGKNGVDLNGFKNQLGVFNDPSHIFIDAAFLTTLPERELYNGYAEMLKHGLIADEKLWNDLIKIESDEALIDEKLIYRTIKVKLDIVEADPKEQNVRMKLNFGHTIGHALESHFLSSTAIAHGHAVALGICAEAFLSLKKKKITPEEFNVIETVIIRNFPMIQLTDKDITDVIARMKNDKKNNGKAINFVLLEKIGSAVININLKEKEIGEALFHLNLLGSALN
jgi:3-dehydroquinate synthase